MGVSAEERIRQLQAAEAKRRKELEEKKQELEKKKKELDDLEKSSQKEIANAQKEIREQIEELVTEEREQYQEDEKKKRTKDENLEEKVGPEKLEHEGEFKGYGDAIERVMHGNTDMYSLTNYNVVNRLESLADEARSRPLTKEEREFVKVVEYRAKELSRDDFYRNDPGQENLKKELDQITFINKMTHKKSEYTGNNV